MLHLNLLKEIKSFSKKIKINKNTDLDGLSLNPAALHLPLSNTLWTREIRDATAEGKLQEILIKVYQRNIYCNMPRNNIKEMSSFEYKYPVNFKLIMENFDLLGKSELYFLSGNPFAVELLEERPDIIFWPCLSSNPAAIHLLED